MVDEEFIAIVQVGFSTLAAIGFHLFRRRELPFLKLYHDSFVIVGIKLCACFCCKCHCDSV